MPLPRAAYIHVPFCRHRCGYCNFTLVAGRDDLIAGYLQALELELRSLGTPREMDTLFLGGGTPTHLSPDQMSQLFSVLRQWFPLAAGGELSVEANPADLDDSRSQILAQAGVTRVSIGAQSFNPEKLNRLERDHQAEHIEQAVRQANRFAASVSLDLIFGVPDESLSIWQTDLQQVLDWVDVAPPNPGMGPRIDHVSTYGLTFDRGAAFYGRLQRGELNQISEQDERVMYELAIDTLVAAGFEHYEVSNFAQPGKRCRHNETYWLGGEFYAAGPGAARYIAGRREVNHRSTTTYIRRMLAGISPTAETEELPPEDRARERLVFGLRRLTGVERNGFAEDTGYTIEQLGGAALKNYVAQGLLVDNGSMVRLTRAGLLISDALWPAFLRR